MGKSKGAIFFYTAREHFSISSLNSPNVEFQAFCGSASKYGSRAQSKALIKKGLARVNKSFFSQQSAVISIRCDFSSALERGVLYDYVVGAAFGDGDA